MKHQQVLGLAAERHRTALSCLDFYECTVVGACVVPVERMRQQLKPILMRCQDLANAPDEVPVWSEATAGKEVLELCDDTVQLTDEAWDRGDCRL
ncbi:MAG: hypothetical protein IV094_09955 [Vitreoscilla sp.]|nr:hypothetical protein [Vitreoscilla sp.]